MDKSKPFSWSQSLNQNTSGEGGASKTRVVRHGPSLLSPPFRDDGSVNKPHVDTLYHRQAEPVHTLEYGPSKGKEHSPS